MTMWKSRFAEIVADRSLDTARFAEAMELRNKNLPASLYKYRAFTEQSIENLRAGKVWAGSPASFNDPLDSAVLHDPGRLLDEIRADTTPSFRGKSRLLRLIQGEEVGIPRMFRQVVVDNAISFYGRLFSPLIGRATHQLRAGLRICCFSTRGNNAPMWTHYAADLTGFCIRWDLPTWSTRPDLLERLFPVLYDHQPFQMPHLAINPPFDGAEVLLALRKAADWSYEDEWRYIERGALDATGTLVELPRPAAVHIGPLMTREKRQRLSTICRHLGVTVIQMEIDLERGRIAP